MGELAKLRLKLLYKALCMYLKLSYKAFCIYIAIAFLILVLFKLNQMFDIAKKLSINFKLHIYGNTISVPAMGENLIMSTLASLILGFASAIFYKCYFSYKYKKEQLQSKITNKKKLPYKSLAILLIYLPFNDAFSGLLDEINTSLSTSLRGVSIKDKYLWIVYFLILLTLFAGNMIEMGRIKVIFNSELKDIKNSIEIEKYKNKSISVRRIARGIKKKAKKITAAIFTKQTLIKIGLTIILSFILLLTSFGVSRLPEKLVFEWAPEINGQIIELFSNKNNLLFALFFPMLLFVIFYNYVFPAFDKNPKNQSKVNTGSRKEICFKKAEAFFKNFILTIINTIAMSFFVSSVNSLQNADFSNISSLIPLIILICSSLVFAIATVKQFEKKDELPSNKGTYGISEGEFDIVAI